MRIAVLGRYSTLFPLVRDALADSGWEVQAFTDDQALTCLPPLRRPDLILVDVGSQDQGMGWEAVARLKGEAPLEAVPIIVSSDDAFDLRDLEDMLEGGVAGVLVQPCTAGDVRRCVAAAKTCTGPASGASG